jgi:hypothetical protein
MADAPPLTIGELARLVAARDADPEFADAIEAAVRRGNEPPVPRDPWAQEGLAPSGPATSPSTPSRSRRS